MFLEKRKPCPGIRYPCTARSTKTVLGRQEFAEEVSGIPRENTNSIADGELVLERIDTGLIDLFSSITFVLLPRIYQAPLPIPHAQSAFIQPFLLTAAFSPSNLLSFAFAFPILFYTELGVPGSVKGPILVRVWELERTPTLLTYESPLSALAVITITHTVLSLSRAPPALLVEPYPPRSRSVPPILCHLDVSRQIDPLGSSG